MSNPPAFQLYAADFYMDTLGWSSEEVGIYVRLLMAEWVNGPLVDNTLELSRIAGCDEEEFLKYWAKPSQKFYSNGDGKIFNKRLEKTRKDQKKYIRLQSKKGTASWEVRKTKGKMTRDGYQPEAKPEAKPEPKSSSSSSSSVKEKDNNPPTPRKRGTVYSEDFIVFWKNYPKKVSKDAAWNAWKKRNGDRPPLLEVINALTSQSSSEQWMKDGGQYVPNPATWINHGRWADELPKGGTTSAPTQRYNQYGKPIPRAAWEDEAERITREYNERKAIEAAADSKATKQP
jgi:uncharacterized protein YdaU (DUF1376 family)